MLHPEWLNQNEGRAYPFMEDADLTDESRVFTLPNGLVVDFILTVEADSDFKLRLATLTAAAGFYGFTFEDADGVPVCTVSVAAATHVYGASYGVTGLGDYTDCRGRISLGRLESIAQAIPDGIFSFRAAYLEPCVVRPDLRAIRSLSLYDGGGEYAKLSGHIKLIEGSNIKLTYIPTQNAIRIDAIPGENFEEECECDEAYTPPPIRTINGISAQNIVFEAGPGMAISRSGNTLTISNPEAEPCCDCTELELLISELSRLQSDTTRLETYAQTLDARVGELNASVHNIHWPVFPPEV